VGSRLRPAVVALVLGLCFLVIGAIPGSSVHPVVFERELPSLPVASRGDAEIDVTVVTDPAGAPVPGARVSGVSIVSGSAFLAASANSDATGRAELTGMPEGDTWVLAEAPGLARVSSHIVLAKGGRAITLALAPEQHLDVTVHDDLGKALAGAEIEIQGADPLPIGARTGASGAASVHRLGAAPWIVTVRAGGYESVTRRSVREGQVLAITLRKLGAIRVAVVGWDDLPVEATVLLAGSEVWPPRSAETDRQGHVRLGALSAGSYALRATAGDRVSPIELGVTLARGEDKEVVLRVGPGRFVSVRVMDGDAFDALPIPAARVSLAEAGLSPFPLEGTTDKEGRVRLGPIAPGSAYVSARAEGFVPRAPTPVPDDGGPLTLVLVRAGTLAGRVVDARGFPIDGASIEIVGTDPGGAPIDDDPRRSELREAHFDAALLAPRPLIPSGELGVVPGPVPPIPHGFFLAPVAGAPAGSLAEPWVTRNDGTFRATPASPGRIRALVRHPQYVEALSDAVTLAPGGEAFVVVVLRAGGALEGRVVDARGQPVSRARVTVAAVRGSLERTALTATDGTFAFASLPGAVTLTATPSDEPSDLSARASVTIPEGGRETVTLTLPEARPSLTVRVKDDRGYPLDTVQLTAASLDPALPLRTTVFTDPRGEARIPNASGLALRLEARAPGHAPKIVRVEGSGPGVSPSGNGGETLELTLDVAQSVSGEVRTTRGDPLAGADVAVATDVGTSHATTDRSGAFALLDLPAGSARVVARAAGFAPGEREIVIASKSSSAVVLPRFELAEEGVAEGVVLDARGDPVPGARVARDRVPTYLAVGPTPRGIAVTDARGRFRLGELPQGDFTLEAYAPDMGRASIEAVHIVAGRTTSGVEIRLQKDEGPRSQEPASVGGVAVTLGEAGDTHEIVLVDVAQASEAERAGLAAGDVVLQIDGAPVHSMADARAKLAGPMGDDVVIQFRRGEETDSVRVAREPVRK
jgi:hypothetical protein